MGDDPDFLDNAISNTMPLSLSRRKEGSRQKRSCVGWVERSETHRTYENGGFRGAKVVYKKP
jgi:hypothetical protein